MFFTKENIWIEDFYKKICQYASTNIVTCYSFVFLKRLIFFGPVESLSIWKIEYSRGLLYLE